jgi:hypothetical protein
MCHYVRLFIQSAGEKHAIMSTVSILSDLLERVTCYLWCDVSTIEFGNYGAVARYFTIKYVYKQDRQRKCTVTCRPGLGFL